MKVNRKSLISWIITLGLPIIVLLIPTSEAFTSQIRLFFAITLMGIAMFCFDEMENAIAGLLMMALYIITGLAPISSVFSAWTNTIPWYILTTLLLVAILEDTSILRRVAYKCIILTGGTYNGIIYGITITAILSIIIIPGTWTSLAVCAITVSIIKSLDLPVGKASGGIIMAACFGFHSASAFVYSPSGIQMFLNMSKNIEGITGMDSNFVDYFLQDLPMIVIPFILAFIITKVMKPEKPINGKEYFQAELKAMGPMTASDKKVLVVLLALLVYLFTNRWHGLDMFYGFLLAPIVLYLPGIRVGKPEHFRKINFNIIFFIVACLAIGVVAAQTGAGTFLTNLILPMLSGTGTYGFLAIVFLFGILLNFLLTPMAAMSSVAPILSEIAMGLGVAPLVTTYSLYLGLDQLILPYEIGTYLIFFGMGYVTLKDFAKCSAIKMAVSVVFTLAIMIPWWMFVVKIV
jgi:di/tricarboxylate transporter